jgi:hypothetical protein
VKSTLLTFWRIAPYNESTRCIRLDAPAVYKYSEFKSTMQITITTPALLFPAISLLLLAYTSRFLALAALMRDLWSKHKLQPDNNIRGQIQNIRIRLKIIRNMQILGALSFFLCVFSMLVLFIGKIILGEVLFGISLLLLMASLAMSIWELQISIDALNLQVKEFEI